MILYQQGTAIGLALASIPAIAGVFVFYTTRFKKEAFYLVLLSALLLRVFMIALDPYLQNWDERFHAVVAKHMIDAPFTPMQMVSPVLPYNYQDWWHSHIWVHKQPLFMWQMALSMALFGVNTIALRLPMVIMGVIGVWMVKQIALKWTNNESIGFLSALFVSLSWYLLELTSGLLSLDHNDFTFWFYVTAGIWAWSRYIDSTKAIKWAVLTGVFVGCAVLVKWLTAFVVFGGWGLYVLLRSDYRSEIRCYVHIGYGIIAAMIVFVPWQVYIINRFPLEAAWSYKYNVAHITRDLGHDGPWYFHFKMLGYVYDPVLVILLIVGIVALLISKSIDRKLTWSYLAMIAVVFGFFSFVAAKMPAFVFPVAALMFIFMAAGLHTIVDKIGLLIKPVLLKGLTAAILTVIGGYFCLQPMKTINHRGEGHAYRNRKLHNTEVYKRLDQSIVSERIILNCPLHEHLELMFWRGGTHYSEFPEERLLDSLQQVGYKFAAFEKTIDSPLPAYILNDPDMLILRDELQ